MTDSFADDRRPGGSVSGDPRLPYTSRRAEDVAGHWLLARLGKTVLRPGGRRLTEKMVEALPVSGHDVVELAPGIGLIVRLLLDRRPASYVGIEEDPSAARITRSVVGDRGRVVTANAMDTGLADGSADVVVGEAMLTMNTDQAKARILAEVARVLRPGGHYTVHELALVPDAIPEKAATEVRRARYRTSIGAVSIVASRPAD